MKLIIPCGNKICLTIILFCLSYAVRGQLAGTKSIPGDYPNIASAVAALNSTVVGTGGVIFNIASGYTETITSTISLTTTGTVANPVLFQKDPNTTGANPLITSYTAGVGTPSTAVQDGIWRLLGVDYITIDGIDITDNPANISNPSTMEYGYALYKASTTNGCEFVTIRNCVITLNNINNAVGAAPMADGSSGIIVMNALATAAVTPLTPATGGTNSNNKFYKNIIQNCNTGIAMIGFAAATPFTLADANNDVGGNAASTGNTIINYGGAASAANPAIAIRTSAQYNLNVSFNIINNNNGSGINHPNALRGIFINAATSASSSITNNTITLNGGGTTQAVTAIENASGSTAASNSVNISNNLITNCTYSTATTGGFYGIYNNLATPSSLIINSNTISNNSSAATTAGFFYAIYNNAVATAAMINSNTISGNSTAALTTGLFISIYNTGSVSVLNINNNTLAGNITSTLSGLYYAIVNSGTVTTAININANNIGTNSSPAINFTAANSGGQVFISNSKGGTSAALSISNNIFYNVLYSQTGTGANTYISNVAATLSQDINSNSFNNLSVNTTGAITFISNSVAVSATGTQNVNGNSIAGTFAKTATGGSVTLFYSIATSLSGGIVNNNGNNFSNITATGTTTIAGWVNTDAGASTKTIQNNTFSNWVAGNGAVIAISVSVTSTNNATTGNLINNISGGAAITGIATGAGRDNIYLNIINTLSTTGASPVSGIQATSGTTKNIYRNKIYDLQASNAASGSTVNGILISGTSIVNANIYNNLIGDLRTPLSSATDPIRGISITSSTTNSTINVYYNTVYINASSTGATFGTTGVYHTASATATTATLNLRNNIITNTSTFNGTGLTVAYRRSSNVLTNYASTSNNNLFYAGPAGSGRLLFYDGTNSNQTLTAYKTQVSTRDAQSVTEDLVTSKFLSVSGASASFLHIDPSKATQVESGAVNISGFINDYDADARASNDGYSGTGTAPDIGADEFGGTASSVFAGIYSVGTGQTYTSLTNAGGLFAAINSLGLAGNVTVDVTSDLTEDGTNSLNLWAEQGIGNYTLTIQPDASTLRTISGNPVGGLIRFNGVNRVTINGSNGTASNYLTFRNTNASGTTGTAFTFVNGASNNTLRYCNIEAFTSATAGVVLFSTSTLAGGNSNNTISNCNINATVNGNTGNLCIYAAGTATAGFANSSNTISNNNIFNYRDRGLDVAATGSTAWLISANSFYNGDVSGSITYAANSLVYAIRILGGAGYSIINNAIGGNAALASGTAAVYAATAGLITFEGILLTTTSATPASNIKGNTVGLISVSAVPTSTSTSGTNVFLGIETNGSGINIGGSLAGEGNIIGSNTINGSILITTTTTVANKSNIRGINCASTGGLVIGNQVGGIDIKNIGSAPGPSTFLGIYVNIASAPSQVINNIIGSNGTGAAANSIRVLSSSTSVSTALTGILVGSLVTSTVQISGNIIQNFSHQSPTASGNITGIGNNAGTTATLTITNNTISSNSSAATAGTLYGIFNSTVLASIAVNSNTISGNTTTGTSTVFYAIYNSAATPVLNINSNLFTGNITTSSAGLFYAIYNSGAVTTTININSNIIGNSTSGPITFNAANSAAQNFIINAGGTATAALSISNNNFQGITYAVAGTGGNTYITNSAATLSQAINGNTFTNLNINTSGSVTFISDNVIVPATGTQNVNNNSIVTGFTKRVGSTVTLYTSLVASVNGAVINNNSNNFSNITVTGATTIAGWVNTDAGSSTKTIQNNTFINWSGGTNAVTVMSINITGTNNATTGNIINNISSAGSIIGISTGAGNDNISSNIINTLASSGVSSAVSAITVTAGTTKNIYKNKIYDLSASIFTTIVNGIVVSGGTTVNIYNNMIGDLRTPVGSNSLGVDMIRGISLTSILANTAINVYYNTIYLNASSTGTTFSTSGIYHVANATATTATLNLRNNSITNTSTPKGVGITAAYRITNTSLGNYASTSNNNLFYAGTPGSGRLIFYDSTNTDQTLAAFKTRMSTRDAQSVTENLTAKFLSTSGSSGLFLHMDSNQSTAIESGAVNISGFTDDFDGQTRAGNTGYSGSGTLPDIGADEIFGIESVPPTITYTVLTNTTITTNRNVTGIAITDASGVNINAGTKPRIYFKRLSDANAWLDNTSSTSGWKYSEATNAVSPYTFTINYSLLYGGSTVTAGVIQYFIVAQDLATIANVAINSGTFNTSPASVALSSPIFPIGGTINSYNIPFSGSYNVGASEVITSLTKADGLFASINTVGLLGNTIFTITSDLAEDGTNALNQWTESGVGNYTTTIQPDAATLRTISGNVSAGLIRLNGTDRLTIDGSNSGTGIYLSFKNTNTAGTTGTAFTFINGATNNTVRYCDAEAFTNATNAVVLFSTSSVTGGNSNNLIDNCTILSTVAANTGSVAVYSAGTTGNENSSNIISNNNIYNYRDRGLDITATGSTAWTISGNSFYNGDVSKNIPYAAATTLQGIRVLGGSGYSILNNYIGGNISLASGTNSIYASTLGNLSYQGILLSTTSATPASNVKGNAISSITVSSVPTVPNSLAFTGIATNGSGINIGGSNVTDGNIVGSPLMNGSIVINTSTTSVANTTSIVGIDGESSGGLINNNQVGGIDISNVGASPAPSFFQGIYVNLATPAAQIDNNVIGSTSITNSIRILPASTSLTSSLTGIGIGSSVNAAIEIKSNRIESISNLSTTSSGSFTGINNSATLSSANITIGSDTIQFIKTAINSNTNSTIYSGIISSSAATISNNIINSITLSSTGVNSQVAGVNISGAYASTVSGNIISNLSTASTKTTAVAETGTPAGSAIIGILNSTTVAGQTINNNRLSGFNATSTAVVNVVITGIGITSTGSGNIFNNRFGTFINLATGSAPAICHIMAVNGSFNVYNNTLRISNLTNTNGMKIYGIVHASANNWNYFHNSVRVSGSSNGTALRSAAFLISVNSSPILKDNIFFNIRTGTGSNYAISNLETPATTWPSTASDYNDLYSINSNTLAEWGAATSKTFAQWRSLSGGDVHSINNAISFILSTYDLEPDSITNCNFVNAGTPITSPIVVNTDINNNPRSAISPDLGAYEFRYIGFTVDAGSNSPVCSGDSLFLTANPGNALIPTYTWRNSANVVISTKQNPVVALAAGQYKVTVSDSTGCFVSDSTLVSINQRPTARITSVASVCDSGLINLIITVTGTGTITGSLSNDVDFSGTAPTITIPVSLSTTTSYSITDLSDASCTSIPADMPDTISVSVTHRGDWLGVTSNWKDSVNWCGGILPTSTTDVNIPSGTSIMPIITSSVNCNNLTINAGDTLSITVTGILNISGTLSNFGVYKDNGTTAFTGTSGQQTFSGVATFNNLTLNNTAGLLLPAAITINKDLTISAGTLNANNFGITIAGNWLNNVSTTAFTPGTSIVTFSSATSQVIGGGFATGFNNLTISNTVSTVTLQTNITVSGSLLVTVGTFDLAAFTANSTGSVATLTVANNATLKIGGTNSYPTNYATSTLVLASTVEYSGVNQTIANQPYGNLKVSSSGGAAIKTFPATALTVLGNLSSVIGTGTSVLLNAAANITVNGDVTIGASTTFNGGSYTHNIGGNWTNNGTYTGSTGTIVFNGSGKLVSGSGAQNFNNLAIASSRIGFSASTITLTGNLATTGSGSFVQASGGTMVMSGTSKTISGSGISLDNLTLSGSITTSISFNLSGNLAVNGSFSASGGTVTMSGSSKSISGSGTISFSTLSSSGSIITGVNFLIAAGLIVNGSFSASAGTATFTGTSSVSGTANLYNVTVNGTSLQLSSGSKLGIANVLTIMSGNLDVTTSGPNTVNFNGTGAQNVNSIAYSNLVLSNGNTKTAVGAITTNYDITIGTGTTFNPSSYTISVYGNWNNNGTFVTGTSTVQFLGPSTAYISGTTTFNILTSNTTNSSTQLILQSNVSASIVNMTYGTISTGSNTLTITNTRTGNGIILGNIQRTNAFSTGVAYAFEGPDNTITFSAVSSVTSITVSVAEVAISDFPFGGSISRLYNISVPSGTYNATLRLHYDDDELNGNNESSMVLWHYNGSVWSSSGKTANSTTSNYVEQSGLTNVTNRWTCSDNSNLVQWNGSVSTDWNTAANWTVIQGSGSRPPSSSDIVDLGTSTFTNQPLISNNVTVKNIIFGSAQSLTLTLGSGGSLTTLGDVKGNWTGNATHTINVNDQALVINGNLSLGDGTIGHAINLNIGSGTLTTLGSLTETGAANINFSGAGTLNIFQDFNYSSGTFTAGSGTVVYNGVENQNIANVNYYNLTINKTGGLASINAVVNISANLLITAGELDNFSTTTIAGNVTINSGSILNNSQVLHIKGNWNNNGSYISSNANIYFDGNGTQNISASTFNNFIINKPVGSSAILTGDIVINGDLTITSGTLNIHTYNCNRSLQGGTLTLADSATFIVGANNSPLNFSKGALANSSTVIADGVAAQAIFGVDFGNLIFRNGGLKTLVSPINVNGNLTIESGATFDGSSNTLTLNGNWINNGTFTPSTSTVLWSGTTKNITGNTTFNNVTVLGSYTIINNVTFNSLLNITRTGSLSGGGTIVTILNGDLINSGVLYTLGTTTFSGNVLQTLSLINAITTVALTVNFNGSVSPVLNSTSAPQFGYLNINNTGGITPSVGYTIANSLTVGSGSSFNGGVSTHNIMGSVTNNGTITSSGILNFLPSTAATINLGNNFSSTGSVIFGGAGAITMAGTPVSFHNVVISNSNSAGVTPSSNWNTTNNLTINNGSNFNAGSYSYLVGGKISNSGTINSGTSTFILNGTATQDIYTLSPFNNLTINNRSGLTTLSSNTTVNRVLNFTTGKIQTGSYNLIQPSTGTLTGAGQSTGWVSGNLQKNIAIGSNIVRMFEVGDNLQYTPVSIFLSNVTASGDLTNSTTASDHPRLATSGIDSNKTVNRYFTITNTGTAFANASITFNWVTGDIDSGAVTAAFNVNSYNGSRWTSLNDSSPLPTSIKATGVLTFGDFAIGQLTLAIWNGSLNTDWFTSSNWSSGVPLGSTNASIPGSLTNYPLLNNGTALVQNITILTGATVTVTGAVLKISGAISNSGIFTVSNGNIEMNGSVSQVIAANTFSGNTIKNLTVNNSAGVSIADTLLLTGILKLLKGNFTSGGHLTLISNAAQTALIDGSGTGDVLGNVTIQRYLASGFGYKYFSSPFQSATVNEFSDDMDLAAAFPSFYSYNENAASSGWVNYTNTTGILNPGQGYTANLGASAASRTVNMTGVVNNNTVTSPVLGNHNMPYTQGFNLVGNPYASPIDWDASVGWSRSNIDNAVYYFNAGSVDQYTGTYSSYINGISSDGIAGNIIAGMQGFFVHVSNGTFPVSATLTFNNSVRVNNLVPNFHRQTASNPPLLRLSASFTDIKTLADAVVIYFEDGATRAFDQDKDALKLLNTDSLVPNLYAIASNAARLSIGAWPGLKDSTCIIPLGLQLKRPGLVTFNAGKFEDISKSVYLYLLDAKTNTYQDLRQNPVLNLYLLPGEYINRFSIVFSKTELSSATTSTETFIAYNADGKLIVNSTLPSGEKGNLAVINMQGQVIYSQQLTGNGVHQVNASFVSGVYLVSFTTTKKIYSKKIFIGK